MADGISYRMVSGPTVNAMRRIQRDIQNANVAAVRAAGKALAAEAKTRAPIYEGPRPDVQKGRLRKSIKAGRVHREPPSSAWLMVGPFGWRARLYAGKEEARSPYMGPAFRDMATGLGAIAAKAYQEAINKGAR